ncbi:MAG: ABC transporter ATP-binding protein [Gloeobacteraceae cyanobacterium ES-bin-144]|nr:ABC transporter ATP-binding protein [Verrucomicrobiales bacterium]
MKQFLPYYRHLRAVKWPFAIGVLSGIFYAVASGAGLPLMIKVVFPVLFDSQAEVHKPYEIWMLNLLGGVSRERLLFFTCLWIPFIFIIRAIAGYTNSYLIQYSGMKVLESIRTDLFVKLQGLPLSFFKKNRSGDLLARLMGDTDVLRQVIAQASSDLIKQPATLLSALGALAYLAYQERSIFIALIALVTIPACVMVIRTAGKQLTRRARKMQALGGTLTSTLTESLQSPLEIRAYNLENRQIANFTKRIAEMLKLAMKVVKYRQAITPCIEVVAATGFAAALYFGVSKGMSLNGFLALGMALYMAFEPIKKLGNVHSLFRQGEAALERIEYISKEPDGLSDPVSPIPFRAPQHSIRFENLTFAYGEEPVLRDVNVEISIGKVVALVGPSGAGKTTFANLIPRFYDPMLGAIKLDGTNIRQFTKKDLRSHIAIVPQTPTLFIGTIAENIRIGKLDASDEEIYAAARKAFADDFIKQQPDGYQTQVGERGDQLSGGQRQRIAIARAFLRDAPILILDEATSALDSESEAMVQQALAALVKGRTTFIIAHRFSTITIADRILVFEAGRIVADGNHEQLRERNSIYQSMLNSQSLTGAV